MKRCLSCQDPLKSEVGYHRKCLLHLFEITWTPAIKFGISDLPEAVSRTVDKMSISGVQMKASVRVNPENRQIEVTGENGTHILKPEPVEYPELPQCENLCMNIAAKLGMETPAHALFMMADGKPCYIVRRFDRNGSRERIHKEDMAQLLQLDPERKYDASLESIGKIIKSHAKNGYLEALSFFERIVLCFIIGNGDMHLKNWSLLTPTDKNNRLAPCYDLVSSALYLPKEEESALSLNGKRNKLTRNDFLLFASHLKFDHKASRNSLEKMIGAKNILLETVETSELSESRKEKLMKLIEARIKRLQCERLET